MSTIVLDFESYYDKEYSLRKMTPVEYILDPRWECTGCAVIDPTFWGNAKPRWIEGPLFPRYVQSLRFRRNQGEKIKIASHNALFDMSVLAWRYGFVPDLIIDTMGMARALIYAYVGFASLEKVAEYLGLPPKGSAIKNVSGMTAADIKEAGLWDDYVEYAKHDAELCYQILHKLAPSFPADEFLINDMVVRCAVLPKFKLDPNLLAEHKWNIEQQKANLLVQCGIMDKRELMSNDKFAAALLTLGVTPGMKTSPTTGNQTYSFAKSDPFMIDLTEHDDPRVQALVAARTGMKSTLEESRTARLISISQVAWPGNSTGWAPIPLRYSGAHTHRLSGDWKLNAQNWPKYTVHPDGSKTTGKLRLAHKAPPGHKVVKADAAQIEARIVAWLAGQDDLVEAFRTGRDIYSEFAQEQIYHYPVSKETVDERFVGKNTILGAGFGMGAPKFKTNVAAVSYVALGRSVDIDLTTAATAITGYRRRFDKIPRAWKRLNETIPVLAREDSGIEFGPVVFEKQAIRLPNGLRLFYHDLHWEAVPGAVGGGEWKFKYGKKPKRIFGGKMYENIVQALARIITMQVAVRLKKRFPTIQLAHQEHDALTYIVRDDRVQEFAQAFGEEMGTGPAWAQGLPLSCEIGIGGSYGECK